MTVANLAGCALGVLGLAATVGNGPVDLRYLLLGFAVPVGYLAGITAVAAVLARDLPGAVRLRVPLVLATMHICWGAGFLSSPRRLAKR